MQVKSLSLALLLAAALVSATQAAPPAARATVTSGWASVIVTTGGPLSPAQTARLRGLGAGVTRRLPLIGAVAARVPRRHLAALTALPFVRHVSPDGLIRKCDEFTVGSSGAASVWQGLGVTGRGVTVA